MPLAIPQVRRPVSAVVVAVACGLLASACATVDSGELRTGGMNAAIVVTAGRENATVAVNLSAGGTTSVELQGQDRLIARSGSAEATFDHSSLLGLHTYTAELSGVTAPGTRVAVDLERGAADSGASSTVVLPPPLRVRRPVDGRSASRSRDLIFAVNRAAGSIEVQWEGGCIVTGARTFAEDEPVVVPAGSVTVAAPPSPPAGQPDQAAPSGACTVTWTVSRIVRGSLGDEFAGGRITAVREAHLALRSTR